MLSGMANAVLKHSIKVPRLYKSAAVVLTQVKAGNNVKSVIDKIKHPNKKGIMALVSKTMRYDKTIEDIFKNTKILTKEENMDENLAAILVTELLWGKKLLQGDSKPVQTIMKYKEILASAVESDKLIDDEQCLQTSWRPRYVRINTIQHRPDAVINYFKKNAWTMLRTPETYVDYIELIKSNLKDAKFIRDYHMEEVLLFPFGTVFAENNMYRNGSFVLQDKASCMATRVLSPEPGSTILDMCAAPGMKTTHLAAHIKNQGKIFAVERDKTRFVTLKEMVRRCKAKCVTPIQSDVFLAKLDRSKIEYILLDPSCSGTGMLTRNDQEENKTEEKPMKKRLKGLSNLQGKLLRHALTDFPFVKRVVYSTCSIHAEENEKVVEEALSYTHNFKLVDCPKMFKNWTSVGLPEYSFGENCIRTVSDIDCTNGFFIAAFERKVS
ncbi:28S rRNA (cytosine-C(5))-methyltransferase [Planococcus citri]|uniref:28S rRNA (cytosine-C(5))-methyltransferase n=1 Tax=Planococcus citri TaxID=170843 RepID=UPI0031FA4791